MAPASDSSSLIALVRGTATRSAVSVTWRSSVAQPEGAPSPHRFCLSAPGAAPTSHYADLLEAA